MGSPERREPRILLVEDDPVDRMAVERMFAEKALPYELLSAGTVAEAVESHRERPPGLALLDYGLPDGNGLELQAMLDGIPCVFITAHEDVSIATQALKDGAFDFLVKDTDRTYIELLPAVIERTFELHRLREEARRHTEELDELVLARTRELEEANESLRQEITERLQAEEGLREERTRLELAQKVGGMGFLEWNLVSNRITFSDQITRMYGVDPAQDWMAPEFVAEVVHPDDLEFVQARLVAAIRGEESYDVEHRIVRPDGTILWTHSKAELILGEDGEPVRLLGTSVDVTEQAETAAELQRSEEKYRGLFENSVVGVAISRDTGELLSMNREFTRITGYTLEEFSGISLEAIYVTPEDRGRILEIVRREGAVHGFEVQLKHKDGAAYWVNLSSTSITYDGEEAFLATVVDMTERKRAEEELRQSESLLAESQRVARLGSYSLDVRSSTWSSSAVLDAILGIAVDYPRDVQGWLEIVHPDHRSMMRDYLATNILANHERCDKAFRVQRVEDGVERWMHGLGELALDTDGNPVRMIGTIQDITERKRAEQALSNANTIINHSPAVAFLWKNEEGWPVEYVSENVKNLFGYTPEEFRAGGVPYSSVIHADDREGVTEAVAEHSSGQSRDDFTQEYRIVTKDGQVKWIDDRTWVRRDEKGRVTHFQGMVFDITDLHQARAKLREMNVALEHLVDMRTTQLVAANQDMEAFAYSVSHDLKAPLRAIDGYSGILEESHGSSLPEDGQRLLREVRSSAQHMAELIDDLLEFSRIGRVEIMAADVDMRELAETVFSDLSRLEGERTVDFSVGELPIVRGDAVLLRLVWTNLLANALKFTGGREVARIEVDCQAEPGHWVFRVQDNGAGFDMTYVDKLFGVFQRLHYAGEFPGTGVGLAIVRRIVERHRGEVWAEGEVDAGATVFIRLPRTAIRGERNPDRSLHRP